MDLHSNEITDISPLEKYTSLIELNLYQNSLVSISPNAVLKNIKYLYLGNNKSLTNSAMDYLDTLKSSGGMLQRLNLFSSSDEAMNSNAVKNLRTKGVLVYTSVEDGIFSLGGEGDNCFTSSINTSKKYAAPGKLNNEKFTRIYMSYDENKNTPKVDNIKEYNGKIKEKKSSLSYDGLLHVTTITQSSVTVPVSLPKQLEDPNDTSENQFSDKLVGMIPIEKDDLLFFVDLPISESILKIEYQAREGGRVKLEIPTKESKASGYVIPGEPIPISFVKLWDNGPDDEHMVFLSLGDGFSIDQLGDPMFGPQCVPDGGIGENCAGCRDWSVSIADAWHHLFTMAPLDQYATFINIYRMDIISDDSGILRYSTGNYPTTPLSMQENPYRIPHWIRSIVTDIVAPKTNIAYDQYACMTNANMLGQTNYVFSQIDNVSRKGTALHELGHSIGLLVDEGAPEGCEENEIKESVSINLYTGLEGHFPTLDKIPWKHWLVNYNQNSPVISPDPSLCNPDMGYHYCSWDTPGTKPDIEGTFDDCSWNIKNTPAPTWLEPADLPLPWYESPYWPSELPPIFRQLPGQIKMS